MAKAEEAKLYRTFVRGLVTEAGYLTYPEDSSTDELNTVISRKGNRTRRLGIDYENGFQLNNIDATANIINEYVWLSAASRSEVNFLCLQVGSKVHFFSLEAVPVSDSYKSFTVDLLSFKAPAATVSDVSDNVASFAAGRGFLFITHPYVEPIVVEYDPAADSINAVRVIVQIRDFEGLYDGLANDEEPTTLSNEHHYNLRNQGWMPPGSTIPAGGVTVPNQPVYNDPYTGEPRPYEHRQRFEQNEL